MASRSQRRAAQTEQRAAKAERELGGAALVATLVFVRHGETDYNRERRLQGQRDVTLNERGASGRRRHRQSRIRCCPRRRRLCRSPSKHLAPPVPRRVRAGREQAAVLGAALAATPLAAIYSSDLSRARETAAAVAAAQPGGPVAVVELAALRERALGVLEGLTDAEAAAQQPAAWRSLLRHGGGGAATMEPLEGGVESTAAMAARVAAALGDIARRHAPRGEAVAVVSHGGALSVAYAHIAGRPFGGSLHNCCIGVARSDGGRRWSVQRWNDTSHLQPAAASGGAGADGFGGGAAGG